MAQIIERRNANGHTTYHVRIRRRGFPPASASFLRKTDANRWISETEQAMREGRYLERIEGRKHTLTEAIARYLAEFNCTDIRKTHLKRWNKEIGHKILSDIQPSLINEVLGRWKREPNDRGEVRQGSTLNRLTTLNSLFMAVVRDWQWHTKNPIRDVRRHKEPKGRVRFLTEKERDQLLLECKKSSCRYLYLIVVLALSTGMRKAEILNLRWKDIDLEKQIVILHKTKNGERRRVAVKGYALQLLREHGQLRKINTDFLFPGELTHINEKPYDFKKPWSKAKNDAHLKDFVFHDLRHSCASYLAMGGATPIEIAEVLGHKTLSMVKRYSHLTENHVGDVVEKMNQKIFNQCG